MGGGDARRSLSQRPLAEQFVASVAGREPAVFLADAWASRLSGWCAGRRSAHVAATISASARLSREAHDRPSPLRPVPGEPLRQAAAAPGYPVRQRPPLRPLFPAHQCIEVGSEAADELVIRNPVQVTSSLRAQRSNPAPVMECRVATLLAMTIVRQRQRASDLAEGSKRRIPRALPLRRPLRARHRPCTLARPARAA
jgi:hypothetical protein